MLVSPSPGLYPSGKSQKTHKFWRGYPRFLDLMIFSQDKHLKMKKLKRKLYSNESKFSDHGTRIEKDFSIGAWNVWTSVNSWNLRTFGATIGRACLKATRMRGVSDNHTNYHWIHFITYTASKNFIVGNIFFRHKKSIKPGLLLMVPNPTSQKTKKRMHL